MNIQTIFSKCISYFTDADNRFNINRRHFGMYKGMPYDEYLKYELDLEHPKTFNEKLQWLKLYDRRPIYTTMVDKYAVKKYVADIIGKEYIIPTLGLWDKAEDIDFGGLP